MSRRRARWPAKAVRSAGRRVLDGVCLAASPGRRIGRATHV
ncbi:hypothetical protein [Streptomyces sp. TLI_146]|nr:hypothetical protein [Streptomyces sp. TLI_146]